MNCDRALEVFQGVRLYWDLLQIRAVRLNCNGMARDDGLAREPAVAMGVIFLSICQILQEPLIWDRNRESPAMEGQFPGTKLSPRAKTTVRIHSCEYARTLRSLWEAPKANSATIRPTVNRETPEGSSRLEAGRKGYKSA